MSLISVFHFISIYLPDLHESDEGAPEKSKYCCPVEIFSIAFLVSYKFF